MLALSALDPPENPLSLLWADFVMLSSVSVLWDKYPWQGVSWEQGTGELPHGTGAGLSPYVAASPTCQCLAPGPHPACSRLGLKL